MKIIHVLFCCIFLFVGCNAPDKKVTIKFIFSTGEFNVTLDDGVVTRQIKFDKLGNAKISFPVTTKGYYILSLGRMKYTLYMEPEKTLVIRTVLLNSSLRLLFEGELAGINTYLNYSKNLAGEIDPGLPFDVYCENIQQLKKREELELEQNNFGEAFVNLEIKRLEYRRNLAFLNYLKTLAKCEDENVDEVLQKMIVEDQYSLVIPEYVAMMKFVIESLCNDKSSNDQILKTKLMINYIDVNIKDTLIAERLLASIVFPFIAQYGIDEIVDVDKVIRKYLNIPVYVSEYDSLYAKWERLLPGKPMFNFNYEDDKGQRVSLEQFRGKYVYIDLWATWCIPCQEELPYFHRLRDTLAGKNIEFVSISIDRDKGVWKNKINELQLGGVQLFAGYDQALMDFLNSTAIPRFILVDKNGNLIRVDMGRPSNFQTRDFLFSLD